MEYEGFPCGSEGKESVHNAGDPGSTPGLGRSPGEGNGYPLQCSCLEKPMDKGAWWAIYPWVHKESDTAERLSIHTVFHEGCTILHSLQDVNELTRYMIICVHKTYWLTYL